MRIVRPMVKTVGGISPAFRDLARLQKIARVLAKHGLGALVAGVPIPGVQREPRWSATPRRAVMAIQELGPTFVKLGQVLSTRPDILPDNYLEAFQALQDDVSPLPWSEMTQMLDSELGSDWPERIVEVDEEPLATASIAQVHRAVLADGAQVVLKIQRTDIERTIEADLGILKTLARRLLYEYPEARSFDPRGVLSEFDRSIHQELDFTLEASHMVRFTENYLGIDFVHIPVVYEELTTRRVLTMEYLDGVKMRGARAAGCDMAVVGDRYLTLAYEMLFVHGFFHGDLHPGNVLVLEGDELGVLDFGMVGTLTDEMRANVVSIVYALQRGDFRTIARLFYEIAIKERRVDYKAVERDTIEVMEKHWGGGSVRTMQMGAFVMDLAQRAARHGARVPLGYTMFFKAIVTSEGLAKTLVEEVDPIAHAQPYFQRMLAERFSPDKAQQEAFYSLLTLTSILNRIPVSLVQLMDDLDDQRLVLNIRTPTDDENIRARDRLANRIIVAAFAMTFIVAGAMALDTWVLYGVPVLSLLLWLGSVPFFGLGALMLLWNLGRRRRSRRRAVDERHPD